MIGYVVVATQIDVWADVILSTVASTSQVKACLVQTIKDTLDVKFGAEWHCVVGEAFSYEVTHQVAPLPNTFMH